MKQKKVLFINVGAVVFCALIFSGCSLRGKADGGIFRSTDGGNSFEQKNFISESSSIAGENILDLEIDRNNRNVLYIGTQVMGVLRSVDGGDTWVKSQNNFTNVEDIALNPNDSNEIYVAAVVGGRGKIMKTTNGGTEWQEVFTENNEGARVMSIAIDKNNPKIVYAGDTLGGIYKTYDQGATWATLLWQKSAIDKIEIDNSNTSKVYLVTRNNGIWRSDDAGANFVEIESSKKVYNLVAHPAKEGVVFISDDNGLQRSDDSGKSLILINTLVKPENLGSRGLAINFKNDNEIYFASGKAFYKTTNGGQTWKPVQFDTTRTIEIIKLDPNSPDAIYIGTNKRGSSSGIKLFPTL
jgi:photosystem II stability/assembly factor-like uncharacterized protein